MTKITLSDVSNLLGNPTSAANTINANNDVIVAALDLLVSRDGETPNQMTADIDLNNNDLLNAGTVNADNIVLNGAVLVPGDVTTIPPESITAAMLGPSSVTNPKIATGAVSETKIADGAVTNPKLATGAVSDVKVLSTSALSNRILDTLSPNDPTFGADGGGADDHEEIQATWDAASTNGKTVGMFIDMNAAGELTVKDNITIRGAAGAILTQTDFSDTGSFISNLDPNSSSTASIKRNVHFEGLNVSGLGFPSPIYIPLSSGSTTTALVFGTVDTLGNPISTVDDFYNGLAINVVEGAGVSGSLRFITDYVGSTRTATISSALSAAPAAGDDVVIGWNDNAAGFAAGMYDISFNGGILSDYPATKMVPPGTGGKGLNYEQGVTNGSSWGQTFRNNYTAVFIQGVDGTFANGEKKRTVGIRVGGYHADNCGSVLTIAGINTSADPDGDSDDSLINASFITYENAGHNPYRIVGTDQQKSGILNFLEAQNVSVSNIRGRNASTYPGTSPGYPADYSSRVGFGLTGDIGAMVWGWGRNIKVTDFVHHGNVDSVVRINRGRALGDDAGGTGIPQNCFNWCLKGIEHHGVINEYIVRIDSNASFRVANTELTGEMEISVNGGFVTLGLVDPNMSTFTGLILTLKDHVNQKTVIGTPAQIIAAGNTFASFGNGTTDLTQQNSLILGSGGAKVLTLHIGSLAHDFGSVAAHTQVSTTLTVTGAVAGTKTWCIVTYNGTDPAGLVYKAQVTSANTVTLFCLNTTAGAVSAVNRTYSVMVITTA